MINRRTSHDKDAFCSWSGGKDSALALHLATKTGVRVRRLLTMMTDDGRRSRSHGLSRKVLELQSASLGIPLVTVPASWEDYEEAFLQALLELRTLGIDTGVFGAIDVEQHRSWIERVCNKAEIRPILPLWKRTRESVFEELMRLRFGAVVVAVREDVLGKEYLGQGVDEKFLAEMRARGVDLCGENGEYHTLVTTGPGFTFPVAPGWTRPVCHGGYWFLADQEAKQ